MVNSPAVPAVQCPQSRRALRILLAEDDAVNRVATLYLLRLMGHRADFVANGIEALDALAREEYDAVLMDIQMPLMDGLEAARQIRLGRAGGPAPWVIALTAGDGGLDREQCLETGMDDFLRKPIRADELREALAHCPASSR